MRLKPCFLIISFFEIMPFIVSAQTDTLKTDSSLVDLPGVVVSASRRKEKILQAPVSIEKMDMKEIRQSAQPSFFDAIENIKGVQMITPSLGFKVINARGFTNTTNVRFVQMVDGMDIQAPLLAHQLPIPLVQMTLIFTALKLYPVLLLLFME